MSDTISYERSLVKGNTALMIVIFACLAVGAGVVTWMLYPRESASMQGTPSAVRRPTGQKLVEIPIVNSMPTKNLEESDAGLSEATDGAVAEEKRPRRGKTKRSYAEGKMDKRRVQAFIRMKQGQVKQCYERRLKTNNMLQGVLLSRIRVAPTGRVTNVSFTQDTLHDSSVRSCVAKTISRWKFPAPDGGAVTISTPFRFAPRP